MEFTVVWVIFTYSGGFLGVEPFKDWYFEKNSKIDITHPKVEGFKK
jgi:hypothetical protein